jgi:hypothetical protein
VDGAIPIEGLDRDPTHGEEDRHTSGPPPCRSCKASDARRRSQLRDLIAAFSEEGASETLALKTRQELQPIFDLLAESRVYQA